MYAQCYPRSIRFYLCLFRFGDLGKMNALLEMKLIGFHKPQRMTTSNLKIRTAIPADLAELQDLFTNTVKSTCSEDYTPDQIEV